MGENKRVAIYAAVRAAIGRHITPDERLRIDRLLDGFDIPRGSFK
jgi:hypothetical protein